MVSYSLIIATFERPEDFAITLEGVEKQTRQPAEILVVDSSRDDRTRKVCEQWAGRLPVRWMYSEAKSAAKQRNQGALAAASSSDLLAFLDDDITMYPDTCALICEAFDSDPAGEIGGIAMRIDEIVRPHPSRLSRIYYRMQAGYTDPTYGGKLFGPAINCMPCYDEPQERPGLIRSQWLNSAGVFFRRELFMREKFPEFDGYSAMEDVHCSARIGKTHRLYFHALARSSHRDGTNSHKRDIAGMMRQRMRNQRLVARDVMGLRGLPLAWKFFLHRLFVTLVILRRRGEGWGRQLRGTWT